MVEQFNLVQVELSSLLDAARDTETKMVEMSALNHLMSTHVLQQAQQIEYLYDQVRKLIILLIYLLLHAICMRVKKKVKFVICKNNNKTMVITFGYIVPDIMMCMKLQIYL